MLNAQRVDAVFYALSDPTRRQLVERLSASPASMKELASPFSVSLPTVLKHLAILEESGIVRSEKAGRVRTFAMQEQPFAYLEQWVAERKAEWNERFDRLEHYLDQEDV